MNKKSIFLKEGMKIYARRKQNKQFHKFQGEPREICHKIVNGCWNGRYYKASNGHFSSFYIRDFGMSVEALIYMGHKKEVEKTLEFALRVYEKNDVITTTITSDELPIDFFEYGADSIPYLIRSLRISKSYFLLRKYSDFLEKKIKEYYNIVFDEQKNIVKENKHFSSMKDNSIRKSSLYDNCCMAMLNMELRELKNEGVNIYNPFFKWNYKKIIRDRFWVGTHFLDDISNHHYIATDANTIPYFFNIYEDKEMILSSIHKLILEKLDSPLPAKYTKERIKEKENKLYSIIAPNYEGNTCWTNLGVIFMSVVAKVNKLMLKKYIDHYLELIEEYGNFLEVFNPDGKPYKTRFYLCDEGMLWSSIFFKLLDEYYHTIKHKIA